LQKSTLKNFTPDEETIAEEGVARPTSPALSNASGKSGKKSGGLKSIKNSIKRKLSHRNTSQSSAHAGRENRSGLSSSETPHDRSETSSVSSEVFPPTTTREEHPARGEVNTNNSSVLSFPIPAAYDQPKTPLNSPSPNKSPGTKHLSPGGKLPLSPSKQKHRQRSATLSGHEDHVITPPVIVDGEVKRDYQYVSPVHAPKRNEHDDKCVFRSSSFAKILGRAENGCIGGNGAKRGGSNKEESPLKALYKATVLNDKVNKENSNNHNNLRVPIL